MNILQAVIYGIVQGVGEFLPISSTAHLILIPWLFHWKDPGLAFDVALHVGTAAAVISFFWKDWLKLIKDGLTNVRSTNGRLFWLLVIATIPGGIAGILLDKPASTSLRSPLLIGFMLIIMGLILYMSDKLGKSNVKMYHMGIKNSLTIGISQVFAIIPGVSRSGITMSVGRIIGMTREDIAKFTFLLSTPIILGDALYHAKGLLNVRIDIVSFAAAVITAAIFGMLSIKFLLNYLKNKGFGIFVVYRILLGIAVITVYLIR